MDKRANFNLMKSGGVHVTGLYQEDPNSDQFAQGWTKPRPTLTKCRGENWSSRRTSSSSKRGSLSQSILGTKGSKNFLPSGKKWTGVLCPTNWRIPTGDSCFRKELFLSSSSLITPADRFFYLYFFRSSLTTKLIGRNRFGGNLRATRIKVISLLWINMWLIH